MQSLLWSYNLLKCAESHNNKCKITSKKRETKKLLEKSIFVASHKLFPFSWENSCLMLHRGAENIFICIISLTFLFISSSFVLFGAFFSCFVVFTCFSHWMTSSSYLPLTLSGCKLLFIHEQISFFTHYPTKLFRVFIFTHSCLLFDFSESFFFHEFMYQNQ